MVKCENRVRVGVAAAQKMATGRTDAVQDAARRKQWLAWIYLALAMSIAGSAVVAGKLLVGSLPVFLAAEMGLGAGLLIMLPMLWLRKETGGLDRRTHATLAVQALCGIDEQRRPGCYWLARVGDAARTATAASHWGHCLREFGLSGHQYLALFDRAGACGGSSHRAGIGCCMAQLAGQRPCAGSRAGRGGLFCVEQGALLRHVALAAHNTRVYVRLCHAAACGFI